MVFVLVVVAVTIPSRRLARRLKVRRVGVNQFTALEFKLRKTVMAAAVHQFHRIIAAELINGSSVCINANVALCYRLAFHNDTSSEMRFDVNAMRRHQRDDGLTQSGNGFGAEI